MSQIDTVGDFYDTINAFAPFSTARSGDNVGLLVGGREQPVQRALLALDCTGAVLEEAIDLGAQLIVTHHPVIYQPLSALRSDSLPYRAAAAGIAVLSAHTNLDMAAGGVNDALAARLGLQNIRPLSPDEAPHGYKIAVTVPEEQVAPVWEAMSDAGAGAIGNYSRVAFYSRGEGCFLPGDGAHPVRGKVGDLHRLPEVRLQMVCPPARLQAVVAALKDAHPYEVPAYDILPNHAISSGVSMGRLGDLPQPLAPKDLAQLALEQLRAPGVRYTDSRRAAITTVAVCGGSGGSLLEQAVQMGAQALVTGEVKHHEFLTANERGLLVVDAGHFSSENVVIEPLAQRLQQRMPDVVITCSKTGTDALRYLTLDSEKPI